ncbi:hypothetical protein NV379_23335 [Paenibacillus sp. N1-5-1-14]|uniref:hypothetical protein n=1 Tax=Paenibacillus radicibacter TaxID=2972488 RepID=UPI002158D5E5|nr:hypothetical protein [Paenibacillus radicibacter]MCR8645576.1 hypothetical protein [Paenibacillus radicibacter]
MPQMPSTASIKDIITSLQGLTGVNQLLELSNVLKAKGYTLTGKETIVDLITIISGLNLVNTATTAGATATQILTGKEAFANGSKITGTMPDRAGDTAALSSTVVGNVLKLLASNGYRDGVDDYVTLTDAAFIASNILTGKTVHGLAGTATADGTASAADILTGKSAYVNGQKIIGSSAPGKRVATGTIPNFTSATEIKQIRGLDFSPSLMKLFFNYSGGWRANVTLWLPKEAIFRAMSGEGMYGFNPVYGGFDVQLGSAYNTGNTYVYFTSITYEVWE